MSEAKEVKKEAKAAKAAPKKAKKGLASNGDLFKKGDVLEVNEVKFVVKEVKGIDLILSRKDYK